MRKVYLDHAATTRLDERVLEAMMPYLKEGYGNASSVHELGRKARFAVEAARERIAGLLGAEPGEIVFTSGGTESNNMALRGVLGGAGRGLVTSAAEHEAVLKPAEGLRAAGHDVTVLPPQPNGAVTPQQVEHALTPDTGLVSLMLANNEVGTLTDVRAVSTVCHAAGVPFHCDAVQMAGYLDATVDDLGVDLMTVSAHKLYGPKGVGVLYVRGGIDLKPLVEGGSQERGRRGGTENVAAIAGMAEALALAGDEREVRTAHTRMLRDRLLTLLHGGLGDGFVLNTSDASAPHILNVAFPPQGGNAMDGEMLLLNLDIEGVYVSAGSACTSGTLQPSHVLLAMGLDRPTAAAALRFSLGKDTTEDEVAYAADRVVHVVRRMRRQGGPGARASREGTIADADA